ncbi:uncharacterized protein LOC127750466 [Frankliniella occidentalis]|uniref:Odorant receptor n=1 Tax=Frankliniella occidentalis TaxID=133901 RepID=A0A9C6XR67_FRAOC|nr:uncharacterized protein LOC127750466 [Frankliniella occidentalis]
MRTAAGSSSNTFKDNVCCVMKQRQPPGPLATLSLRGRRLVQHPLVNMLTALPHIKAAFLIQVALGFVTIFVHDRSDTAGLALFALADEIAIVALGMMNQLMVPFIVDFPRLVEKAVPVLVMLEATGKPHHQATVSSALSVGRLLFLLTVGLCFAEVVALLGVPLLTYDSFFQFWPPADGRIWLFAAKYALQAYAFLPSTVCVCVLQMCHAAGVTALTAAFRLLHELLLEVDSRCDVSEVRQLCKLHSQLTSLSKDLNHVFRRFLLVIFWAGGSTSMLSAVRLAVRGSDTLSLIFIVVAPVSYFYLCLLGDSLAHASGGLAKAAYHCDWVALPPKTRQMLLMVAVRSSKPQQSTKFSRPGPRRKGYLLGPLKAKRCLLSEQDFVLPSLEVFGDCCNKYLEMYRQALLKSPNGQSFLKDTLETFDQNPQEGCTECKIDSFHATISELELKYNKYKSLLSSVTSPSK